jgi:hypothetical protein
MIDNRTAFGKNAGAFPRLIRQWLIDLAAGLAYLPPILSH